MKLKLACADFAFPLLSHDQALDVIAMLDFDGVDIGLFEGRSHLWPSREFKATARAGARLARKLADRGLRCAHVGSLAPRPAAALSLVRAVPGLTLTLDYTHFTRAGLPDSAAESLLPYASHFHARGARKGRLQAVFAQNTIDYERVLRAMRRA